MQFTPGQVKEALGVSEETLRYWRRVLPGFSGRKGYAPCFGFHDVVCLRLVKEICTVLGIQVSKVVPVLPDLRRMVVKALLSSDDPCFLAFDPTNESVTSITPAEFLALAKTVVILPAHTLVDEVQSKLLGLEEMDQLPLPFPIVAIKRTRRG